MRTDDQQFLVQKIRSQYTEKQHSELDELKELDRKVKQPANTFAYIFGSLATIIMGGGMSFIMTDLATQLGLGDMMVPGIVTGVIGLAMAIVNYPIYKNILASRRAKFAPQILALSEKLMEE